MNNINNPNDNIDLDNLSGIDLPCREEDLTLKGLFYGGCLALALWIVIGTIVGITWALGKLIIH